MDWDAHLRMMQEIRERRYEQLHEVTDRAARLRVAFANQNWDEVEAIKAEVATNAEARKADSGAGAREPVAEEEI